MNPRVLLTVTSFGLTFFAVLAGWLLLGAPGSPAPAQAVDRTGFAGAIRPPGIPAQQLTGLVDEDGRPAQLPREVTIVTFAYTRCEDACPTTIQQVRGALDRLDDPPPVLIVSVDPILDTPERAKAFLADQSVFGRMSYLTGPSPALQQQWRSYGIQPQTELDEHSVSVAILDGEGRQRIGFPLDKLTPEALARDVETLRAEPDSGPSGTSSGSTAP